MASILEFERYGKELDRQLLRRIGYTNGLHKIHRFARVVEYVYPIMPTSVAQLSQTIIQKENEGGKGQLGGTAYASGIIDVARALLLLEQFGPKIALSSQGYGCHAITAGPADLAPIDTFLFEKVIQSDGEYTLNILRMVSEGLSEAIALGRALVERFLSLIEFKLTWAEGGGLQRHAQRSVVATLTEARTTLERAVNKKPDLADFFFKHTINPRIEWLEDLGCVSPASSGGLVCTDRGRSVLEQLKSLGGWKGSFVFLPLDPWLTTELDIPSLYENAAGSEFSWRLAAAAATTVPTESPSPQHSDLLNQVKAIYPFVKLANFNEADAQSLYEVLATGAAARGTFISQHAFEDALASLVRDFPSEIFKLTKRRGRGLYVALKKSA